MVTGPVQSICHQTPIDLHLLVSKTEITSPLSVAIREKLLNAVRCYRMVAAIGGLREYKVFAKDQSSVERTAKLAATANDSMGILLFYASMVLVLFRFHARMQSFVPNLNVLWQILHHGMVLFFAVLQQDFTKSAFTHDWVRLALLAMLFFFSPVTAFKLKTG